MKFLHSVLKINVQKDFQNQQKSKQGLIIQIHEKMH